MRSYFMIFFHHYQDQFIKWADINTGAFFSLFSAIFGSRLLLFIDPTIAKDASLVAASVVSLVVAIVTGYVAIRRLTKELKIIEKDLERKQREAQQDEEAHVLEIVSQLEKRGFLDINLSLDEKIVIAKEITQKISNK